MAGKIMKNELISLQKELDKKIKEYSDIIDNQEYYKGQLKKVSNEINKKKSEIRKKKIENNKLDISSHAMLRFLERHKDINIEEIEQEIHESLMYDTQDIYTNQIKVPLKQGGHAIIKNGVVVTIYSGKTGGFLK